MTLCSYLVEHSVEYALSALFSFSSSSSFSLPPLVPQLSFPFHPLFLHPVPFRAVFPDVPEMILPADGTKSVGMLFNNVLREDGKSQNFAVYMV